MRKILLTIQYNGAHFHGWQKQRHAPSVQEMLETKISALLGEEITLHASGRTDAGVHAIAQTAHFETASNFPLLHATHTKISTKVLENFEAVQAAAKHLVGTHNFRAFCAARANAQTFHRTIFDIKIKKSKNIIDFYITGSGFLYNMVRIIVGTLVAVGEGKILPSDIPKIIKSQERKNAGKTMPPHALYLYKVKY